MSQDALQAVIDYTSAAGDQVGRPDNASWTFARAWMLAVRVEHLNGDDGDIERIFADVLALPETFPGRPKLAAYAVTAVLRRGAMRGKERVRAAVQLAALADADPVPFQNWPKASAAVRALGLLIAAQYGEKGFGFVAALEEAKRLIAVVGDEKPYRTIVDMAIEALHRLINIEQPQFGMPEIRVPSGLDDALRDRYEVLAEFQTALVRQDLVRLKKLWPRYVALSEDPRIEESLRVSLKQSVDQMRPIVAWISDATVTPNNDFGFVTDLSGPPPEDPGLAPRPAESTEQWVSRLVTSAVGHLACGGKAALDKAIDLLALALDRASGHDVRRVFYETTMGAALMERFVREHERGDLTWAISVLEQARDHAKTIANTHWSTLSVPLSHAYRASGRAELGRQVALSGLRSQAWSALLQTSPDAVITAGRSAASTASDVARMCLADGDVKRAVTALELGRGLLLFSSLETRDLEKRLIDAGEPGLAQEWAASLRGASEAEPDDLRRRVMSALTGVPIMPDGVEQRGESKLPLLDPPELAEIRAALSTLEADALVYLLPGEGKTGVAVVVPAGDDAYRMSLPALDATKLGSFESYLDGAARDLRVAQKVKPANETATEPLDDVCLWAWDAAMGPLLRKLKTPGRPARLVLVPVRELARVPWHAAHNMATGERAIERAVLSYTPSARLMCQVAWRSRMALSGAGLVVGDPDTAGAARELVAARAEATAVAGIYPETRYVGRLPDGTTAPDGLGSKADVEGWLDKPGTGGLLHLACHGVVHIGGDMTSYLLLAGGERLGAEELTADLAVAGSRDIALAVLAACSTATSSRSYDEAYSIGSALLAAGVRTVVSAQWSVPDSPTSVLMFMFHHYLRECGLAPVDALRSAQLWALRDRRPPESMPQSLRDLLDRHAVDGVSAWAGFVHSGH